MRVYYGQAGEKFQHLLVNVISCPTPPSLQHSPSFPLSGWEDSWPYCGVSLSCYHSQRLLRDSSGQQGQSRGKFCSQVDMGPTAILQQLRSRKMSQRTEWCWSLSPGSLLHQVERGTEETETKCTWV